MTYKGPREWDATTYDAVAAPMTQRGNDAVGWLELRGDETVLDAGCGTGQVTATLLGRLPRGRVVALDGSARMLELARERLGGDPRVRFVHADLARPLPLEEPLDAILSTSTLHWVADHDAVYRHFAAVLRPGGQLAVDCGGAGNIAPIVAALEELGWREHPWTYPTPEQERARLCAAGFVDVDARLVARPAPMTPEELERSLRTVVLGWHLERLDAEAGAQLVRDVAARLPQPRIDYVRLQLTARRGA